jgi:hypothetical protein
MPLPLQQFKKAREILFSAYNAGRDRFGWVFEPIGRWIKNHIGQFCIAICSVVGIVGIVFYLDPYYGAPSTRFLTGVYQDPDRDVISGMTITIERGAKLDVYRVQLFFKENADGIVRLNIPEDLKRKENAWYAVNVEFTSSLYRPDLGAWYYYKLSNPGQNHTFWQEFEGELFSRRAREQEVHFFTELPYKMTAPIEIRVVGLQGTAISNVLPTPIDSGEYGMTFKLARAQAVGGVQEVSWTITDRIGAYRRDFVLLLGGIWIGVLSNLLAGVIVNLVGYLEQKN